MKKLITYVTAAGLLLGMAIPVHGATFADIDTVTWSGFKPFLNEAATLGLMSGYDEGGKKYCKPRNNVTYCEAVQLMYSIMKVYSGRDVADEMVTKWKPVMSAYKIPDWAYKAVSYSLEQSILETADLSKLQNGTRYANREDVGVIFGKALDTVSGYDTKSGASLSYKDSAQVSASAVPYLELLNRADLMVGDTDNKFNPKANITRAEMAVLSVKNYEKLTTSAPVVSTTEETAIGTVDSTKFMANDDLFLSVKTNNGKLLSLFASDDITPKYDGEKIALSEIGVGDTVRVTYKDTNITSIEVTHSKKGIKRTTQVTYELDELTKSKVIVLDGKKELSYHLDDDVTTRLANKKSSISKLQDALDNKYCLDVTLTLDQDEYVLEIDAKMNDNNPMEGVVVDLDDEYITIKEGSKEYSFTLDKSYEVEHDGKSVRISTFEKEYKDNQYEVKLKMNDKNDVALIQIKTMEDEFNGTLTFINSTRLEFTAGTKTYKYDFADDIEVEIDGKSSTVSKLRSSFKDDEVAYNVKVSLNRDDEVEELIATSKNTKNSTGTLKALDKKTVTIKIGSKEHSYDLASSLEVTVNGKSRSLTDLINYFGEYEFEAELKFDKYEDVIGIYATIDKVESGVLRDIVDEEYITVKAADINWEFDLASSVDIMLEDEEVTLKELDREIDYATRDSQLYVDLEYNSSGAVTAIDAYWEDATGELKKVYSDNNEIKVGSQTYDVARKVEISYKLSTSVDTADYRSAKNYKSDLEGLDKFLSDCVYAEDSCVVSLTIDKHDEVTRIRATAK